MNIGFTGAGFVGIGKTNPTYQLDVTGSMAVGGTTYFSNVVGIGLGSSVPTASLDLGTGTIAGAGLSSCNASGSKLVYNSTTKKFECGTDRGSVQIFKNSNQGVGTTVMAADTELTFGVGTSDSWAFIIGVNYTTNSSGTPDFKFSITAPTNAACSYGFDSSSDGGNLANGTSTCGTALAVTTTQTAQKYIWISGSVKTDGSNSGNVTLNFAQNSTSAGNNTTIVAGSYLIAYKITGADLAEVYYTNDTNMVPGTVVKLDSTLQAGVKRSERKYESTLMGVVSTKPGMVLGADSGGVNGRPVFLALSGRVPVFVSSENGPILPGDYLTSSSNPGVAMKATKSGAVIGQAMNGFEGQGRGVVEVFIKNSYYSGTAGILQNEAILNQLMADSNGEIDSEVVADRLVGKEIITGLLYADTIRANSIEGFQMPAVATNSGEVEQRVAALESWMSVASGSADLVSVFNRGSDGLELSSGLRIAGDLGVVGRTSVYDLSVLGSISSGLLKILGLEGDGASVSASISTLMGKLSLQKGSAGEVEFMDGKVKVATDGAVLANKFSVRTDEEASSGAVLSASAGKIILPDGQVEVVIRTMALTEKSMIFATPEDLPVAVAVKRIDNEGFKIVIGAALERDLNISWWIVN